MSRWLAWANYTGWPKCTKVLMTPPICCRMCVILAVGGCGGHQAELCLLPRDARQLGEVQVRPTLAATRGRDDKRRLTSRVPVLLLVASHRLESLGLLHRTGCIVTHIYIVCNASFLCFTLPNIADMPADLSQSTALFWPRTPSSLPSRTIRLSASFVSPLR